MKYSKTNMVLGGKTSFILVYYYVLHGQVVNQLKNMFLILALSLCGMDSFLFGFLLVFQKHKDSQVKFSEN